VVWQGGVFNKAPHDKHLPSQNPLQWGVGRMIKPSTVDCKALYIRRGIADWEGVLL